MGCGHTKQLGSQPISIIAKQNEGAPAFQVDSAHENRPEHAEMEENDAKLEQLISELNM